jgi:predicted transcriptional regulator
MNEIAPNYLSDEESTIQNFIKNVSAFIQRAKTHYKITELEKLSKEINDLIQILEKKETEYLVLLKKLKKLQYQLNSIKFDTYSKSEPVIVKENISKDPSHEEMVEFLKANYRFEHDDFDIERAIYWFSNIYHGGQSSNLYSVLSTSEYNPGPNEKAPVYGGNAEYSYRVYDIEYDFSELNEFQKSIGVLKSIGDIGIPPGLGGNDGDSGDDLPDELIFTCLKSDIKLDKHTGLPNEDELSQAIRKFILEETEVSPKSFEHELQYIMEIESQDVGPGD